MYRVCNVKKKTKNKKDTNKFGQFSFLIVSNPVIMAMYILGEVRKLLERFLTKKKNNLFHYFYLIILKSRNTFYFNFLAI